jgi:hypothetical protein
MGRSHNANERLDPVGWRPPGRGALLRLGAITVLLATAAVLIWSRPAATSCADPAAARTSTSSAAASGSGSDPAAGSNEPHGTAASDGQPAASGDRPVIPAGSVGVPVRLADPTALALVHPGNRVDLLRLGDDGHSTPVASAALVLDVTNADDPTSGGLLLALRAEQAAQAVATPGRGFAILIRPG